MKERFYYLLIILLLAQGALAQAPIIQKIEPLATFPNTRIIISGSGFNSNQSLLQVWFDQVKGRIVSCSEFSIEVEIPAQARLSNVTVVNLSTRLSAQSKLKFMPVFSGEGFDPLKLESPLILPTANRIFEIISTDVDGDNKPDLIGSRDEPTSTTLALSLNQSTVGNISFPSATAITINAPTGYLAAGDLNLDGKPDVVASRSGTTSNTVFVLTNTSTVGNPSFSAPLVLTMDIIQGAREVGISDLNGDGKPEIVVTNSSTNVIYIFKNESSGGTLTINPNPTKISVTGATETLGLELQDMDGDRKTDIVVTRNQSSDIFVLKNVSTSSAFIFSNITKITLAGQFNDIGTADFNRDGKLDIIATSTFSAQAMVLMNKSNNTTFLFDVLSPLTTDAQPYGIDVSDLNGDSFPDIVIPSRGTNSLNVYLHNTNTTTVGFTKVKITTGKNNWYVRAGDLDGDAKPDIAYTAFAGVTGPFSVDILRNKNCHKPVIQNIPPLWICPAQTIKLETIPMPGLTFDWSNGFSSIKNSTEPFVNITAAANYTVTASGEGGACNVTSAPISIQSGAGTLPNDPVISTNAPICSGNTLTLSTPTVAGATYSWTGPNLFTANVASVTIAGATIANAGIYSLTIKVGDCSSNTVTQRVEVVTFGSFSISSSNPSNSICQGQSLTLTVNSQAGYTFQWMKDNVNIAGQTATTLNVTTAGAYKVKVSNASLGCSQETSAVTVAAFVTPVASFTHGATACVGNEVTFLNNSITDSQVAPSSIIYAWDFGDGTTSSLEDPSHNYTTAQTFSPKLTVSYLGITGCTSSLVKSINIINGTTPTITATKTELCDNESETSTLKVSETFITYSWTNGATSQSINVTAPGGYTVETTDANGCIGTSTITIDVKAEGCLPGTTNTDFPYVFTPNGDSQNDFWIIPDAETKQDCTMNIFDGRGMRIFQKKGFPIDGWNGLSDSNNEVPEGTYYYVFSCPNESPTTGSVLIVR